jgi:hypothetical protein
LAPTANRQVDDSEDGSDSTIDGINKGKGVNGTWFGNVAYLAPGKYTVSDSKGVEQQFLVAEDTEIWGWGDICGDENGEEGGQGGTQCTEEELEAAAKDGGVSAEVVIVNGIATTSPTTTDLDPGRPAAAHPHLLREGVRREHLQTGPAALTGSLSSPGTVLPVQ